MVCEWFTIRGYPCATLEQNNSTFCLISTHRISVTATFVHKVVKANVMSESLYDKNASQVRKDANNVPTMGQALFSYNYLEKKKSLF